MVLATAVRLEFAYPGVGIFAGDSLQYLSIASAHGVVMVFFMIMPLLFGAFANFLLPTQLGVHDVAFPRLNSAAFWFLPGGLLMLAQLVSMDRRYQRMNCFNIRESQALLKRRFFVDLVNENDFHKIFDKTLINLKFKANGINIDRPHTHVFYQLGTKVIDFTKIELYIYQLKLERSNIPLFTRKKGYTTYLNIEFLAPHFSLETINETYFRYSMIRYVHLIKYLVNYVFNFFYKVYLIIKLFLKLFHWRTYYNIWISFKSTNYRINYINSEFIIPFRKGDSDLLWKNIYKNAWDLFFKILIITFLKLNKIADYCEKPLNEFIQNLCNGWDYLKKTNDHINEINSCYRDIGQALKKESREEFKSRYEKWVDFDALYNRSFLHSSYWKKNNQDAETFLIFYSFYEYNTNKKNNNFFRRLFMFKCNEDSFLFYFNILIFYISKLPFFFYTVLINLFNIKFWVNFFDKLNDILFNWVIPSFFDFSFLFVDAQDGYYLGKNSFYFFSFTHFFIFSTLVSIKSTTWCLSELKRFVKSQFSRERFNFYKTETLDLGRDIILGVYYLSSWIWNKLILNLCYYSLKLIFFAIELFFETILWILTISHNIIKYIIKLIKDALKEQPVIYSPEYFNKFKIYEFYTVHNKEFSFINRHQRTITPVFKYDYKSGDYFPKLSKELYSHLFTTLNDVTGGLRPSPWFFSSNFLEFHTSHFTEFLINNNLIKLTYFGMVNRSIRSYLTTIHPFFNLFTIFANTSLENPFWLILPNASQKYHKMLLTSSMQQRLYSNWRQLKFSREAWRCRLLAARHQKTLFKRYVHEDGLFWSIERNAKDLLPGWAMITPFSSRTRFTAIGKVDIALMGILLVLNSSIISGANFLVTYRYLSTLNNRKMRDARAFFTEGVLVASWMMIAANPMLVIGIIMLLSDRHWQTSFFDYSGGGDTILFQHMFWFFGHPEVYIIMIPIFGFTNTMLSYYLRKRISARASLMYSLYTIAFLGFFVWGHHMYMVGLAHTTRMLFSTLTVMISVPAATKLMHWCVTISNSSFHAELPFLFILTFIFLFVSGGISGMCVAHTGMDILFHDTFYVIGHFHVMFAGGAMFGAFGAFYFYFPAIFGVKYSRLYSYLHYSYYLIGQLLTVIPMFWLGYAGMPRRVLDYPSAMGGWHSLISAGHLISVAGLICFFLMIFESLRQAKPSIRNTFGINRYNTRLNFYLFII
jgi:heme/copper-type cytochrome/quinol oxidase subunit 1